MYDCSECRALVEVPVTQAFLLIQKGRVLDIRGAPHLLDFSKLDEFLDWQVYAGAFNEYHEPEIAGAVAKVWIANEFTKYALSTKEDQMQTCVTFPASDCASVSVRDALQQLFRRGKFLDPANLANVYLFAS